ncbi:hypothetical protein AUJ14_02855 [Candidatus Micrarchaeota archaeon CG1_02_55_22]|nr:MAG: hypothetical protein AUJ14_02855 [Candidatus Micrarchaeota archaeon CG1_02_55_22]
MKRVPLSKYNDHATHEEFNKEEIRGAVMRQIILGGQDGLVNVLGIVLGVATATGDSRLVLLSGVAATFAESISMAAVAYTSTKAQKEYYQKKLDEEKYEIEVFPKFERKEIHDIYYKKGFRGKLLAEVVKHITSNKARWASEMMVGELGMTDSEFDAPSREAFVVGIASFVGSLIPLAPFFFMPSGPATIASLIFSGIILLAAGAIKARFTTGKPIKGAAELAVIGILSALAGYVIGLLFTATGF